MPKKFRKLPKAPTCMILLSSQGCAVPVSEPAKAVVLNCRCGLVHSLLNIFEMGSCAVQTAAKGVSENSLCSHNVHRIEVESPCSTLQFSSPVAVSGN